MQHTTELTCTATTPNISLIRNICGHNGSSDLQYDSMSRFRNRIEHQRLHYNLACYFCGRQVHAGVEVCIVDHHSIFCSESCAWNNFQGLVRLPLTKESTEYQELLDALGELKHATEFIANTVAY